jgi:ABC-type transporter Mla subunit MlaD
MARKTHHEVAAGAFVLFGLAGTLGVVLWLGSAHLFNKPQGQAVFYSALADGSTGLKVGCPVQVGGLVIGQIVDLRLEPQNKRTLYFAQLNRSDIHVYANGTAVVVAGLVGDSLLAVTDIGDANRPLADERSPIKITGGLSEMLGSASRTLMNLEQTSISIRDELDANRPTSLLASIKGELDANHAESLMAAIKHVVSHVNEITETLVLVASGIRTETDPNRAGSMLARIAAAANTISRIVADAEPKVGKTLADLSETTAKVRQYTDKDLGEILAKLHDASGEVLKGVKNIDSLTDKVKALVDRNAGSLDEMVQNFVLVSANLKATATEVRRAPWRLLYQPSDKEYNSQNILDAARAFSSGAEQLDQAVTRLGAIDPKTASPEDLKKIRENLQQVFEKFSKAEEKLFKELGNSGK